MAGRPGAPVDLGREVPGRSAAVAGVAVRRERAEVAARVSVRTLRIGAVPRLRRSVIKGRRYTGFMLMSDNFLN
ncbi:unnamed protein product [[Actinomadura] parvosata subsp. kistnae]|nr:unnamed protein product [Actinomadura parvosata subsp. kistnae]